MAEPITQDIIDNLGNNTVSSVLDKILPSCDRMDALVGYFYFSGFKEIYKKVSDKKIRILVGKELDPRVVSQLGTIDEHSLDDYVISSPVTSKTVAKKTYLDNFAAVFNKTDLFDSQESINAFRVFLEKIKEGSLTIKRTANPEHGKVYLLHFAADKSQQGLIPGVVIEGSSNLTYSGLRGQGEHNRLLKETHYYDSDRLKFETLWNDAENITIADQDTADEFKAQLEKRLWLYAKPDPYLVYVRMLEEYFGDVKVNNIRTPGSITGGKYTDLKYQIDAVELCIDRINKFGGVIIADVVGLGKSIIASAVANNLGAKTIIIAPPHLEDQWNDYRFEFDFNAQVFTTGKVEEVLERYGNDPTELLIILDEAHKHRNEDTTSYQALHKLCAGNRVMALTATPFNNDPKDIYALIKLFDTPGQSTLRTVENLSMEFHALMSEYKKLRSEIRKHKDMSEQSQAAIKIKESAERIAKNLRQMIEPVVIRRSRLDLEEITDYREDLKQQGVTFAKVRDPELLEYELGSLSDKYIRTLEAIASTENNDITFIGARYKPAEYLKQGSKFFDELVGDPELNPEDKKQRLVAGQGMIAKFMRRLLVRRFESSMSAFERSLKRMQDSAQRMLDWMDKRGEVPVYKKGDLPDAEDLELMDESELDEAIERFEGKGLIRIPASELQPEFRQHLTADIALLGKLYNEWFSNGIQADPKFEYFQAAIQQSLNSEPNRKIVIFSEYSDTADYLAQKLKMSGMTRVFKYSAADASRDNKRKIRSNFDAGLDKNFQENDYDVLIATDAISEGFNLHRAGSIINYDIPYNPTRVIQRVGRINRINKQVFEELYIFNFFPTITGEQETKTKAISTLKINLIHTLLGEDTKILTSSEELKNYFAKQYRDQENVSESLSWDAPHRKVWLSARQNEQLMNQARSIPLRTRIGKTGDNKGQIVAFGKLGSTYVFAMGSSILPPEKVSPEEAMAMFVAQPTDKVVDTSVNFDDIYQKVKEHLFKNNTQVTIKSGSRRFKAVQQVMVTAKYYPAGKDYCDDIIKIIKEYDGFPDGLVKSIVNIRHDSDNPKYAYDQLQETVPLDYIENINKTADRSSGDGDFVLLSEEVV